MKSENQQSFVFVISSREEIAMQRSLKRTVVELDDLATTSGIARVGLLRFRIGKAELFSSAGRPIWPKVGCAKRLPRSNNAMERRSDFFGEARLKLAEAYLKDDQLPRALAEAVRAADLLPDNRDAQLQAATLLLATAQFEDAKDRLTRLL